MFSTVAGRTDNLDIGDGLPKQAFAVGPRMVKLKVLCLNSAALALVVSQLEAMFFKIQPERGMEMPKVFLVLDGPRFACLTHAPMYAGTPLFRPNAGRGGPRGIGGEGRGAGPGGTRRETEGLALLKGDRAAEGGGLP